ncbi:MAG: CHAT domain-containing protein [Planctomycetes bacterium]|nr:CHAT domain-containing protein [Planctomycetota bacterium]
MHAAWGVLAGSILCAASSGDVRSTTSTLTIADDGGRVEHAQRVSVDGILRAWVESDAFDAVLAVEDGSGALVEDDDSGGRPAPWVDVRVQSGNLRRLIVSAKSGHGVARLVVVELAEDEALRAEAMALRARVGASVTGLASPAAREHRADLVATVAELVAHPRLGDGDALQALLLEASAHLGEAGEHAAALAAARALVDVQRERLPPDAPRRLRAVIQVGNELGQLGRASEAVDAQRAALETLRRALSPEDPWLWSAESNFAAVLFQAGDHRGAVQRWESVLASCAAKLPADDRAVIQLRANVAVGAFYAGDLETARAHAEAARAARDVVVPGSPLELQIRGVLAAVLVELGDHQAGRALAGEALNTARTSLPAGHVDRAAAEVNFALAQVRAGEDGAAREVLARIVAEPPESIAATHPILVQARAALAAIDLRAGRFAAALETLDTLLAELEASVPPTNVVLRALRRNQALALSGLGRHADAADVEHVLLEATRATLPPDHPERLKVELQRAATDGALGRPREAREAAVAASSALRDMLVARSLILAPREAEATVLGLRTLLDLALASLLESRTGGGDPAAVALAFELSETARGIGVAAQRALRTATVGGERLRELREAARAAQVELVRAARAEATEAIYPRVEIRDAAERALLEELARAGAVPRTVSAARVGSALSADEVAVAWRVRLDDRGKDGRSAPRVESLVAFVVQPDRPVQCVDLGPLEPVLEACRAWRAELERAPSDRSRWRATGERVRALVVDPVRRAAPGARRWITTPDGPLLTIPIDALPDDSARPEALLGDGLQVLSTWSFEPIPAAELESPAGVAPEGALLLAGDPELTSGGRWAALPAASREIDAIAAVWRAARGPEAPARILTRMSATPEALVTAAAGAGWIHVATHGAFETDSAAGGLLTLPGDPALDPRHAVRDWMPLVRCELVLTAAGEGGAATLNAEELGALDLRACRLAVLSACETGRGEIVLGQGAASFQRALLAAGAHACVTALWRVPDEPTRELMSAFYRGLWLEGLEPEQALWRAKSALRERRAPPRDWAGWVLATSFGS